MNRFVVLLTVWSVAVGVSLADDKADLDKEVTKFQGVWNIESSVTGGMEIPAEQLKAFVVVYEGDKHTVKHGDATFQEGTQKIDPSKSPKTIDVTMTSGPSKGAVMLGIYEIAGDTLKVCFDPQGKNRPTEFESPAGSQVFLNVHKRLKPKEPAHDALQPEHKLFERFAGEWKFEKLSVPAAGAKAESMGSGAVSAESVGGFFLVSRWSGKVYGADYKAYQSLGYNLERKKYTGCWIDSSMGYRWELTGAVDDKSKELTLGASGPAPAGGTCTFRERYRFVSKDEIEIVGEMQQADKWVAFMTTKLTRKK